jgi:hypothetical protein
MEYAANLSMIVVGYFEVYTIAYIYGWFHDKSEKTENSAE